MDVHVQVDISLIIENALPSVNMRGILERRHCGQIVVQQANNDLWSLR
jgi:hypothetical protein